MSNDANPIAAFFQDICVPLPPLLTSSATQWQTIVVGYVHQPAYEFSEVCLLWHSIGAFTNSAWLTSQPTIAAIAQQVGFANPAHWHGYNTRRPG